MRLIPKSAPLLALGVLAPCVPGVASAAPVEPSGVVSVQRWTDKSCDGGFAWHVVNGRKDGAIRATLTVQRSTGTEEWNNQYVYDLARAESSFVSCTRVPVHGRIYQVRVRLVGTATI